MASNVTESGQRFQGFIVPEAGLTWAYSGSTANREPGPVEFHELTAEPSLGLVASGTPTWTEGETVYLYPTRSGAPGGDGCAWLWAPGATYVAALAALRGWDAPSMLRWSYSLATATAGDFPAAGSIAVRSDGTALAFWHDESSTNYRLRYSTFSGTTWSSPATLFDSAATPGYALWSAAVTLDDDTVVVFFVQQRVSGTVQIDAGYLPTSGTGIIARNVLPAAVDVTYAVTGLQAVYRAGQILLCLQQLDASTNSQIHQYASIDGGRSFQLVETWAASRSLAGATATPDGFVVVVDREVSANSWRPDVIKIGSAFSPLSGADATALFDGQRASTGPDDAMLLTYDPAGALHLFRQPADPTADVGDQAISLDGGATWVEYCGGAQSSVTARSWWAGRTERLFGSARAAWCRDRMLVIATDNTSGNVVALHYGGAAQQPARARYADQSQSAGTYGQRLLWSVSYMPLGEEPPGDVGWTTTDTGTITRTYAAVAAGPLSLAEAFGVGEATEHRVTKDNDGKEVVARAVFSVDAPLAGDVRILAWSRDGAAAGVRLEVRYTAGTASWSWRDPAAGAGYTTLGTTAAVTTAYEVVIYASSSSGRGTAIIRPWQDGAVADGVTLYSVTTALTSGGGTGDSGVYYIVDGVTNGGTAYLAALDAAFTSMGSVMAASSLPLADGRPISSEVPVYVGDGISLQAVAGISAGSAVWSIADRSETEINNLDPIAVPDPRRYWLSEATQGSTKTITITRSLAEGWPSEIMGIHLEGVRGFRSVKLELLDDGSGPPYINVGTFDAATTGLYWARVGNIFKPRESGSQAGSSVWLDRNDLARGSDFESSAGVFPIVKNSSGTWVDGITVAESRPAITIDPQGQTLVDVAGTDGVIRHDSLTILFQPRLVYGAPAGGAWSDGCSSIKLTIRTSGEAYALDEQHGLRKVVFGPVVVLPRELSRTISQTETPLVERSTYPDGSTATVRRGPRGFALELAHTHSHAPVRYDRWDAAATAPDYLKASGTGARPVATAEDVVGVLRGLWDDANDGAIPLVFVPNIPASMTDSHSVAGSRGGIYGQLTGAYRSRQVVGRDRYNAEYTVDTFTFERLTWERE